MVRNSEGVIVEPEDFLWWVFPVLCQFAKYPRDNRHEELRLQFGREIVVGLALIFL